MEHHVDDALLGAFVDQELEPTELARITALAKADANVAHRIAAIAKVTRLVRAAHFDCRREHSTLNDRNNRNKPQP